MVALGLLFPVAIASYLWYGVPSYRLDFVIHVSKIKSYYFCNSNSSSELSDPVLEALGWVKRNRPHQKGLVQVSHTIDLDK